MFDSFTDPSQNPNAHLKSTKWCAWGVSIAQPGMQQPSDATFVIMFDYDGVLARERGAAILGVDDPNVCFLYRVPSYDIFADLGYVPTFQLARDGISLFCRNEACTESIAFKAMEGAVFDEEAVYCCLDCFCADLDCDVDKAALKKELEVQRDEAMHSVLPTAFPNIRFSNISWDMKQDAIYCLAHYDEALAPIEIVVKDASKEIRPFPWEPERLQWTKYLESVVKPHQPRLFADGKSRDEQS